MEGQAWYLCVTEVTWLAPVPFPRGSRGTTLFALLSALGDMLPLTDESKRETVPKIWQASLRGTETLFFIFFEKLSVKGWEKCCFILFWIQKDVEICEISAGYRQITPHGRRMQIVLMSPLDIGRRRYRQKSTFSVGASCFPNVIHYLLPFNVMWKVISCLTMLVSLHCKASHWICVTFWVA